MIQRQNKKEEATANQALPPLPPRWISRNWPSRTGLRAGETELISQWEAQATQLGTSFVSMRDPVARYAFLTLAKFHPAQSMDLLGDVYLFWKTEETKDRVPEFNDKGVREWVLRAWKMVRARSLALKDADALAAEAGKVQKPLKQALADRPDLRVIMPSAFSWITFGNVPLGSAPRAARISSVAGRGRRRRRLHAHGLPSGARPGRRGDECSQDRGLRHPPERTEPFARRTLEAVRSRRLQQVRAGCRHRSAANPVQAWLDEIKASAGLQWTHKPEQSQDSGPQEEE